MATLQNKCGIYCTQDKTTFRIPVNPSELTVEYPTDNASYNVLDIGEIVIPRLPGLRRVKWDSFFPGQSEADAPYVLTKNGFKLPTYYIEIFKELETNKNPFRLTINRYMESGELIYNDSFLVVVEKFETREKGGETGDFYYTMELIEYKPFAPQKVSISLPKVSSSAKKVQAVSTPQRAVESKKTLYVGCQVIANGKNYYSSWGAEPHGNMNGVKGTIIRIVDTTRSKPYLFAKGSNTVGVGWMAEGDFTIV